MTSLNEFEFRTGRTEDMKEFLSLERYVFADNSTPTEEEEADNPLSPEMTTVALHKGKIVATSAGFPFTMMFNGNKIPVDGVTSVGTDPVFRRRGLVRKLITSRLHEAHAQGVSAAILWASLGAIYQRFGYGQASTAQQYRFDPRAVSFQFDEPLMGHCERVLRDKAFPVMRQVHEEFVSDRNLHLVRGDKHWKHIYVGKKSKLHVALHFDTNSNPDGYCTYTLREEREKTPGPDQQLEVREFVYLNRSAFRGLWEYIRSHDLVKTVLLWAPLDDPAVLMLLEPRQLQPRWGEGLWLRVIDVEKLTPSRKYHTNGTVSFEITSDHECPWNIRKYQLTVENGQANVRPVCASVDFQIDINGFATLLCGHSTLSTLCASGRASVVDPTKLLHFDTFFATKYKPFCPDNF